MRERLSFRILAFAGAMLLATVDMVGTAAASMVPTSYTILAGTNNQPSTNAPGTDSALETRGFPRLAVVLTEEPADRRTHARRPGQHPTRSLSNA